MSKKPWENNWTKSDKIGGGGQGVINKVINKDTEVIGTLKVLKSQKDPDRRSRMFREVSTIISLENDNLNIPRVLEHNIDQWKEENITLYVIFEFIEGNTLEEYISIEGTLTLKEALNMIKEILKILSVCHCKEIMHRDIKPDNIILKDLNIKRPVLIDFGLTFNKSLDESINTEIEQQIGNRFLAIPELISPSSNPNKKRQFVSDITQLVGVLFYTLTSDQPMTLLDGDGRMPHQRKSYLYKNMSEGEKIDDLFSNGFVYEVNQRINNSEALYAWIANIENTKKQELEATKVALKKFKDDISKEHIKLQRLKEEVCENVLKDIIQKFKKFVLEETEGMFVANESGRYSGGYNSIKGIFHYGVNVHEPRDYIKNQRIHLIAEWNEDILCIHIENSCEVHTLKSLGSGSEMLLVEEASEMFGELLADLLNKFIVKK